MAYRSRSDFKRSEIMDDLQTGWIGLEKELKTYDLLRMYEADLPIQEQSFVDFGVFGDAINKFAEENFRAKIAKLASQFEFDEGWIFSTLTEMMNGGEDPLAFNQPIGWCVAHACAVAILDTQAFEIYLQGDLEQFKLPSIHWLYGAGRILIGGNRIRGDGSSGTWQVEAAKRFGVLASDAAGLPDITDGRAGRLFGSSRAALSPFIDIAANNKIRASTVIQSFEQLKEAVLNKKSGITIASSWGFNSIQYDSKYDLNIARPRGTWRHQMSIRGVFKVAGQWFVLVGNQWGKRYKSTRKLPSTGFVVTAETFDKWVRQAFCVAYQSFDGYKLDVPQISF